MAEFYVRRPGHAPQRVGLELRQGAHGATLFAQPEGCPGVPVMYFLNEGGKFSRVSITWEDRALLESAGVALDGSRIAEVDQ